MATPEVTLPHIDSWTPLNLSLIVFPIDSAVDCDQQWMREIAGDDGESSRKGLQRTDTGVVDERQIRLVIDPLRIMWTAAPQLEFPAAMKAVPAMGAFTASTDWFVSVIGPWLTRHCPPINRLAFSGKIFQHTDNRDAAYELLNAYLPDVRVDPQSTDFQFRVNRSRPTLDCVADLKVNRLCTWSAFKFHVEGVVTVGSQSQRIDGDDIYGVLAQFDFNTDADRKEHLPGDSLLGLLHELKSLSSELAAQGDIR